MTKEKANITEFEVEFVYTLGRESWKCQIKCDDLRDALEEYDYQVATRGLQDYENGRIVLWAWTDDGDCLKVRQECF